MRIGFLGGTFDPPHNGHLAIARAALVGAGLDRVLLLPAGLPPHKDSAELTDIRMRLAMARLCADTDDRLGICEIDATRNSPSYTILTWRELRKLMPGDELFFIIGGDSLRDLPKWYHAEDLVREANFVILSRPGTDAREVVASLPFAEELRERLGNMVVPGPLVDISSTMIRKRVADGRDISDLVPPAVENYICRNGIYKERRYGKEKPR